MLKKQNDKSNFTKKTQKKSTEEEIIRSDKSCFSQLVIIWTRFATMKFQACKPGQTALSDYMG